MKTREDVEKLKHNWKCDPCWDIADTEGFEEHNEELKSFQKEWEEIWKGKEQQRIYSKSQQLGITGNIKLAYYIESMEHRIEDLQNQLNKIYDAT